VKLAELLEDLKPTKVAFERKARKKISGYGQLGTKYTKNPKYRDKPRQKKVSAND
jgi:hypothetical protein